MSTQSILPDYYPNSIFSVFAFLGFLACITPLPWHLEAWNAGMCLYMIWVGFGSLIVFINSIVWYHNAINWAPVWCDITARYIIGLNFAIPATCLCIVRRLYQIVVFRIPAGKAENRRAVIEDFVIGMGIPTVGMILQYIPQGHRFNIYEDIGCWPFTWNTTVGVSLILGLPTLICLASMLYAILALRSFLKNRKELEEIISNMGHRNLTLSRYIRLLFLSSISVVIALSMIGFILSVNIRDGIVPWTGWVDTHTDFQRVDQVPAVIWKSLPSLSVPLEYSRWSVVGSALLFFAFFGFADKAIKRYRLALRSVSTNLGLVSGRTSEMVPPETSRITPPSVPSPPINYDDVIDISPIRSALMAPTISLSPRERLIEETDRMYLLRTHPYARV